MISNVPSHKKPEFSVDGTNMDKCTLLQDNWEGGAKCFARFRAKSLRISINGMY